MKKMLLFPIILLLMLFSVACDHSIPPADTAPDAPNGVITAVSMESSAKTTMTEETEGTETVPSVPYTLQYKTMDLSERIPRSLSEKDEDWQGVSGITNRNTYTKGNVLYMYSLGRDDISEAPYLLPFTADGMVDTEKIIEVPLANGKIPYFAYLLENGRFCLLYEPEPRISAFCMTEADGTVLLYMDFKEDFGADLRKLSSGFLLNEESDGSVTVLVSAHNKFIVYSIDTESGDVEKGRTAYNDVGGHRSLNVNNAVYLGEKNYFDIGDNSEWAPAYVLDMGKSLFRKPNFRVPENQKHLCFTYGEDGNYYMYDYMRMYKYNENAAPTLVAKWSECGVAADLYRRRMWILDENTFYITTTTKVLGKTEEHLYYIKTEKIPEYDTRQTVRFLAYDYKNEWLMEAARTFNEQNTAYKVELEFIDPMQYETPKEISQALDDKLLYEAHPDMLLMSQRDVPYTHYYDKGIFLDLTEAFGDRVLGCVRSAMSYEDRLYVIPMTLQIGTFVCLPETVDGYLTWEHFFSIMDSLGENEVLTSEPRAQKEIFENGLLDFFDAETQTAFYDSALFCDMVEYTTHMNDCVDEAVGYLKMQADGTVGYTNTTLPARISDGGIKFIHTDIRTLKDLVALDLLFGDNPISFCGYPTTAEGSAFVNPMSRTAILSDTDVKDGCIAFLSYLLEDAIQTDARHMHLPVTESGMRALWQKQRYYYYPRLQFDAIGDPRAALQYPNLQFGSPVGYINLHALLVTKEKGDPIEYFGEGGVYDAATDSIVPAEYVIYEPQETLFDDFMDFLCNCRMKAGTDAQVLEIVTEELSFWEGGATPIADAAKKIQSRVQIYLNE